MSIVARLEISLRGMAFIELCKHDVLRETLENAPARNGLVYADVTCLLIDEDIDGVEYTPKRVGVFLSADDGFDILCEEDLGPSEFENILGKWNLDFLRYLKAVALATGELVQVMYEHERGDTPYEEAIWICNPRSQRGEIETFTLALFDGMYPAEWTRTAIRYGDGSIGVDGTNRPEG